MIVIKVNTGFSGAVHEVDTGLTQQEWDDLSDKEKNEMLNEAIFEVAKPDLLKWVTDDDAAKISDPGSTKKLAGLIYNVEAYAVDE